MITIDVSEVADVRGLHTVLARSVDFPSFYGMNRAALWDAITGLVLVPDHLRFTGWDHLGEHVPRGAAMLQQVLDQYRSQYRPELVVEYT